MRPTIAALAACLALAGAGAARAAPTCQDRQGQTIRCGVQGAMPVGWTLPAGERIEVDDPIDPVQIAELVSWLGGLVALIASMPAFDGSRDADWEPDDSRR